MKPVRIGIPTNDGVHIFPKMLGMASEIIIYEVEDENRIRLIEKRNNPYAETQQHLKTLDMYDLINDCSVIISAQIGKKGITRLQERGLQLIFKKGKIEQALVELSNN
jgi:predicted Fe-Mo cluster-binding NifX family protein